MANRITPMMFDAYTVVVLSPNLRTQERVVDLLTPLLANAGYGPEIINFNVIPYVDATDAQNLRNGGDYDPNSIVELSLGYDRGVNDQLMAMVRVAVPTDPAHSYFDPASKQGCLAR